MNIQDVRVLLNATKENSSKLKSTVQNAYRENHQNFEEDVKEEFAALLLSIAADVSTCEITWNQLKRVALGSSAYSFVGPNQLKDQLVKAENVS